jgi:glycosyltransferase involved in cell wall biosynthesis
LTDVVNHIEKYDFKIIFIDDGSTDLTPAKLINLYNIDNRVKIVTLSRNFGHQSAITCGLEQITADAYIIIDVDLQDPPSLIIKFIDSWENGFKNVAGRRRNRVGESRLKLFSASVFYKILNLFSEIDIPINVGDYRLIDREVRDSILLMPEKSKFFRGMFPWLGFEQSYILFDRNARYKGKSKYSLKKMYKLGSAGIIGFSVKPLKFSIWIGLSLAIFSISFAGFATFSKLIGNLNILPGYTTLVVLITLIGGIQLLCIGIVGEYIGKIFMESQGRPLYLINEKKTKISR